MRIEGDVEIIRFRNEENGYSVVVLDHDGEPLTAAGIFPPLKEGMRVVIEGDYKVHPRFGRQFSAVSASVAVPTDADGMIRYLGSGIIKGVGPKTALQIVSRFKEKTFDIMENYPLRLAEIKGISREKAKTIGERFTETKVMHEAMLFMGAHGLTLGMSMKIFERYGLDSIGVIRNNPYKLIEDVDGVGFVRADTIAKKLGFAEDGRERLRAGLIYVLKESHDSGGNTYLLQDELVSGCLDLLKAGEKDTLTDILDELVIDGVLKRMTLSSNEIAVALRRAYRAEKSVATALVDILQRQNAAFDSVEADIEHFERVGGVTLAQRQKEAVRLAASSGVCVITGGPGTGKTTIVKCMLEIFRRRNRKVMLMAPTGRAAKRLSESTGKDASTIHRALSALESGEQQTLAADVVIVDEVSMMDVYLTDMLLKRLRPEASIVFVGDKDQLPSVGAGNVLADMLSSGVIPSVTLSEIFRQGRESLIVVNAHRINEGKEPDLTVKDGDFFFSSQQTAEDAASAVVDMAARRIPKYLSCEPYKVQVLCPMKNGACGTIALNERLRDAVNPSSGPAREIRDENGVWRIGDKVMHTSNNYLLEWTNRCGGYEEGKGVFNGDLGVIVSVRQDDSSIDVRFEDGREATYNSELRSQLIPAYAVTVHKSQGSEFDAVVIPIVGGGPMIMTRNLLYTAITRARKMVVIVGSKYWVKRMVENDYVQKRYSALKDMIVSASVKNLLFYKR